MSTSTDPITFFNFVDVFEPSEKLEKVEELNNISENIFNVYIWVLCAIGIPGNIITIVSILTIQTLTPASVFIALLAFCDGSALVTKLVGHQISQYRVFLYPVSCKFLDFFSLYLTTVANWVLILICFERFISVVYPLKKVYILSRWRSYMASLVVTGTLLVFFAIIIFLMRTSNPRGQCTTKEEFVSFYKNAWYWIQACLYLFIPFLCIAILTGCIVKGLHNSRRDRRSLMRKDSAGGSGNREHVANNQRLITETERVEKMITIMIVVAASVFLLLSIPTCVYFLSPKPNIEDSLVEAKWQLFFQIQFVCVDSTHAINFFLYFFTAKRFRSHLFKLISCKKCKKITGRAKSTNLVNSSQWSSSTKISHNVHTNSTLA